MRPASDFRSCARRGRHSGGSIWTQSVETLQRDLAPRDQVSRALLGALPRTRSLGLDLSPIPSEQAERRFPTILGRCREYGLHPLQSPIPVAPAAHYWMGGVATDLQAATTIPGLFAVGGGTGVHGANRLASNSLMECLVFAGRLRDIALNENAPRHAQPKAQKRSERRIRCHRQGLR